MSANELMKLHETLCAEARSIMAAKNHDYTSGSGDPYHNFRGSSALGVDPIVGVMLRMQDKMQRIKTFAEKGQLMVKGEGVDDAFRDLINYTVLAYGLSREERKSPGLEPDSPKSGDPVRPSVLAPLWDEGAKRASPLASPAYFITDELKSPERGPSGRYG
jgi:hypothetical protein